MDSPWGKQDNQKSQQLLGWRQSHQGAQAWVQGPLPSVLSPPQPFLAAHFLHTGDLQGPSLTTVIKGTRVSRASLGHLFSDQTWIPSVMTTQIWQPCVVRWGACRQDSMQPT